MKHKRQQQVQQPQNSSNDADTNFSNDCQLSDDQCVTNSQYSSNADCNNDSDIQLNHDEKDKKIAQKVQEEKIDENLIVSRENTPLSEKSLKIAEDDEDKKATEQQKVTNAETNHNDEVSFGCASTHSKNQTSNSKKEKCDFTIQSNPSNHVQKDCETEKIDSGNNDQSNYTVKVSFESPKKASVNDQISNVPSSSIQNFYQLQSGFVDPHPTDSFSSYSSAVNNGYNDSSVTWNSRECDRLKNYYNGAPYDLHATNNASYYAWHHSSQFRPPIEAQLNGNAAAYYNPPQGSATGNGYSADNTPLKSIYQSTGFQFGAPVPSEVSSHHNASQLADY